MMTEEANNYCKILALLGMEEEGDPVAEVARLLEDSGAESWKANAMAIALNKQTLEKAILKAGRDYVREHLMADEIGAFDDAMATADAAGYVTPNSKLSGGESEA